MFHPRSDGKPGRHANAAAERINRRLDCSSSLLRPLVEVLGQTESPFGVRQRARLAAQAIRASRRYSARHPEDCLPPEHALAMLYHKANGVPASMLLLCDAGVSKLSLAGLDRGPSPLLGDAPPRKAAAYMPVVRLKPRLAVKAALVVTAVWLAASQLGYKPPQITDLYGSCHLSGLVVEAGPAALSVPLGDVSPV
jgi:hypothetical protein